MSSSFSRAVLILVASSIVAAALSVFIIFAADLFVPGFTARLDNYALGIGIPLGVAPLLLYPVVHLNYRMERVKADLERMVRTDALIGLANRRGFFEAAERFFTAPGEADRVVVMMADIDHFKQINDRHGHAAGDEVLRHVAGVIARAVAGAAESGKSFVARIGGEEFAILIAGPDAARAASIADRICGAVRCSGPVRHGLHSAGTVSIGVALRTASKSLDEVMSAADKAGYEAKRLGRDRWVMAGAPETAGAAQAA